MYSFKDYVTNPFLATAKLGGLLSEGSLRLFLGAGVSRGFGLPGWRTLIARVLGKEGDAAFLVRLKKMSAEDSTSLLDAVDDKSDSYARKVQEALYRDVEPELIDQLPKSRLLVAMAALVTGSCRGRVSSIVTYNYDDLLEQFLELLGYSVCRRTDPDMLVKRADAEVSYVHGCLPQNWKPAGGKPPEVILSQHSFRARRAGIDEGWAASVVEGFRTAIGVFVGLSGDDGSILDILERVKKRIKRRSEYSAYWLLTPEAFRKRKDSVLRVGACPIRLAKGEIPKFLFKVCQDGAG